MAEQSVLRTSGFTTVEAESRETGFPVSCFGLTPSGWGFSENETLWEIRLAASSAFAAFDVPANDGGARSLTLFRSAANLGSPVGFEESSNIRMSGFDGRF
jgi:hypothetical protein